MPSRLEGARSAVEVSTHRSAEAGVPRGEQEREAPLNARALRDLRRAEGDSGVGDLTPAPSQARDVYRLGCRARDRRGDMVRPEVDSSVSEG